MNDGRVPERFETNPGRLATIQDLAKHFGVWHYDLARWMDAGELPGYITVGLQDRKNGRAAARGYLEADLAALGRRIEALKARERRKRRPPDGNGSHCETIRAEDTKGTTETPA